MMDKDEFKRRLAEFFADKKVKTVRRLEPGMVMVCTRGADFDPATNALWDQWGNKSAVRDDVRCCGCCEALAVSNWAYGQYVKMTEKPRPYCIECAGEVMEKEAAEKEPDETKPE
ncbi:MAG TPA: hypothetical protein VGF55_08265 [Gemmataceae bacterium]